ncbi:MAG: bifunctional 4-hydroxy-2-oxoglutarate aldolase/2-dehydro-3-deoxy-phosphogluconate aldolase [Rhodocyclaceae bacterium]|nr:bifunctional 4-hydroxy-2-oxoglutarate aldolase/2-dehydro-3-deoxy-phosphogluconate aldolase [Rhodocyclaceae bacterium]MBP7080548.1 bifunctional 4-hydroxy-2-oxoglutarate aldolase/2-dehydro-3-deoxy-phosphogluconate aldolase [Rhodocyclaceae bacterium]
MLTIREIMQISPVMPVLVINREEDAVPLARALVAGGLRVLEITLRTSAALEAIRLIAEQVPDAVVGVGTVTRPEQFAQVKALGAVFAVSPGMTNPLIDAARAAELPFLPGVMTPSDVMRAMEAGLDALKLFPAEQAGGIGMLKAIGGPLPEMKFCPTGGVTVTSAPAYLALPNVGCVGGSWIAPADLVRSGNWAAITELARAASALR